MLRFSLGCLLILAVADFAVAKEETPANLVAGKKVEPDAKIQKGDRFVAVWEKKNYVVEIRDVKVGKKVNILWVASGETTDDVPQTDLYHPGDSTPLRKSGKSPLPAAYQKFDKNKDGQVGLYEWDRAKYAEFRKLDKNRDGFLTPQELNGKGNMVAGSSGSGSGSKKDGDSKELKELPNPGNLLEYEDKFDSTYLFTVTGKIGGDVWGTGPYAVESDLAAVAVHSGILKDGVSGSVKVTIVDSSSRFAGSAANGVTSTERDEGGPGFTIEAVKKSE